MNKDEWEVVVEKKGCCKLAVVAVLLIQLRPRRKETRITVPSRSGLVGFEGFQLLDFTS